MRTNLQSVPYKPNHFFFSVVPGSTLARLVIGTILAIVIISTGNRLAIRLAMDIKHEQAQRAQLLSLNFLATEVIDAMS